MRLPLFRLALISTLALPFAACGGDSGANGNGNGNGNGGGPDASAEPEGEHHTYAIDELLIPTSTAQATRLGLDLDGSGETNNSLGILLSTVGSVVDGIDLQATLDEQFQDGTIIVLTDLQATALDNASNAAFWAYIGDNPGKEPCDADGNCGLHLDGETSFEIAAGSPTDARVSGSISGGAFVGGPGNVSLSLSFIDGIDALNIDLVGARVEIDSVSDTEMTGGIIGGGVTIEQIEQELMPAIATGLTAVIDDQCGVDGEPDPCGCPADSTGDVVQDGFDDDDSCDITAQELLENDTIATLIQADVDLLDEDGNFDPTPEGDPDFSPDSMSLGVGFSAVGAAYTSPNE